MKVLYGTPLPPGVDAPTRGELRIRIEKLILKDDLISTSETSSGGLRPYSIPVEHCALSPLFLGEQHHSCQCLPSTPKQPRGVAQLVYPLKTFDGQFAEYLAQMSESAVQGVQIVVFVPSSYSGRSRPIRVGKSIVSLDALKPSSHISGWFTIISDGTVRTSENTGELSNALLDVGKVKLMFSITFFSRAPLSPPTHALARSAPRKSEMVQSVEAPAATATTQPGALQNVGLETENTNDSPSLALVDKKSDVEAGIVNLTKQQQGRKRLLSADGDVGDSAPVGIELAKALPSPSPLVSLPVRNPSQSKIPFVSAMEPTAESLQRSTIGQLLLRGTELREKMNKAVAAPARLDDFGTSTGLLYSRLAPPNRYVAPPIYIPPPSGAEHLHGGPPAIPHESLETSVTSFTEDSEDEDDEVADGAENKVQKGNIKHNSRNGALQTEVRPYSVPFRPDALCEDAYVEVDLYRIAFSSGPATLGMEEMRIGVRLSKDVKTDEPIESYSSYVHRVPLARGADQHIVLGFHVRVFSEDKSRMVVSFYRVQSEPESNPRGEQLLPPHAAAQRVLVGETLLGMCIVGLHAQSRDILLHDPITGEDPTQAHLVVRIRNRDGSNARSGPSDTIRLENSRSHVSPDGGETLVKSSNPLTATVKFAQEEKDRKAAEHHKEHPVLRAEVVALPHRPTFPETDKQRKDKKNDKKCNRPGGIANGVPLRVSRSSSFSSNASTSRTSSSRTTSISSVDLVTKEDEPLYSSPGKDLPPRNFSSNVLHYRVDEGYPVAMPQSFESGSAVGMNGADVVRSRVVDNSVTKVAKKGQSIQGKELSLDENRFRMHVCIRAGKEFPMVTIDKEGSLRVPTVTMIDQLESGVRSAIAANGAPVLVDSENRIFRPPTTFFVVEDVFSGADLRVSATGAVPDWFVEAAVRGECDQTQVVPHTQNPNYDYEAVLSLPRDAVFLRQTVEEEPPPTQSPAPCLREMRLTLWHIEENEIDSSTAGVRTETEFWAKTALLGECRVDLRSLRFLKVLDGWYRVNAVDRVEEVVGYVRVSVRML